MSVLYYINNDGNLLHTNDFEIRPDARGYNINIDVRPEDNVNVRYFVPNGRVVCLRAAQTEFDIDRYESRINEINSGSPPDISLVQGGGSRKAKLRSIRKKYKSKKKRSKKKRSKKKRSKRKSKKR
tara:strand:+ start:188 stop:565 length:378 start_codon:yes stop_codon:yes gene_type:complete